MNEETKKKSILKSLLICLPMLILSFLMVFRGHIPQDPLILLSTSVTFIFLNVMFILMIYTGQTHKYRLIVFVALGFLFPVGFIANLIQERGSMALSAVNIIEGDTPFCHIVIPMLLIPAAFTKTIIFPGSLISGFASISSMFVIWIIASLSLGRGWCSWVCFFGGMDEGFSSIRKKPVIKKIDKRWTYLPYVILAIIVVGSAYFLTPFYCEWFCPFKTVTEFEEIISFKRLIQTIMFVGLFVILVVILPILSKRRTQCGLFCPMGPFQSWTNKINIFDIRIDKEKCTKCQKCIKECPLFAIDEKSLNNERTLLNCSKCGKCVDTCPKGAISFHIKGTPIGLNPQMARILFIYPAYLLIAAMGGGIISNSLFRIFSLIFTGSMI